MNTTLTQQDVASIHAAIMSVDLAAVSVATTDRHIPRKEQAALARKLFKSLGIQGVSVTAPNYSMAHSVDVRIPRFSTAAYNLDGSIDRTHPLIASNNAASAKIEQILLAAFPNDNDRSEYESDYFDFCWSIQTCCITA